MDFLAQRRARLFLRPAAPQQLGQLAAQHRARRGQGEDGKQRPRFAAGRQDAFACQRPGFHLPDQPQANEDGFRRGMQVGGCHNLFP
jgi:hypothetical protein